VTVLLTAGCGTGYARPTGLKAYTGKTASLAAEHRRASLLTIRNHVSPHEQSVEAGRCRLLHHGSWTALGCPYVMKLDTVRCRTSFVIAVRWDRKLRLYAATAVSDQETRC
jgi:hypothetical protein